MSRRRAPRWWLTLAAVILATPAGLAAQVTLRGRVLRVTDRDTVAVPRAMVVLHRIHADTEGPIDSLLSPAGGAWRFQLRPDSGALYLLSARWGGVTYFGGSFTAVSLTGPRTLDLFVSDTASTVPVMLATRQVVVMRAEGGAREVIDAMTLINPTSMTRVLSVDHPWTWRFLLPPGATDPHLGDSDFAPEALATEGDTVMVLAPIPPGHHVLMMSYRLPPGVDSLPLPMFEPPDTLLVMLEEQEGEVPGLQRGESRPVEDRLFTEWLGRPSGEGIVIHLPVPWRVPSWFLSALVAAFGAVLGAIALLGRRPRQQRDARGLSDAVEAPLDPQAQAMVEAIAALDRAKARGELSPEAYREQRQELKGALLERLRQGTPAAARPEPLDSTENP